MHDVAVLILISSAVAVFGSSQEIPEDPETVATIDFDAAWPTSQVDPTAEYRRANGSCILQQRLVSEPLQIVFPIRALPCDAIGPCTQEFRNEAVGSLLFHQLDPDIGHMKQITIQGQFTEGAVFIATIASVLAPPNHAGVNANITTTFELSAPGSPAIVDQLFLNGSDDFDPGEESMQIQFPADTASPTPVTPPALSIPLYQGVGTVELPLTMIFDQEATITNTGMFYQFAVVMQIDVRLSYEFDPAVLGDTTCDGSLTLDDWRDIAGCLGGPLDLSAPDQCDAVARPFTDLDFDGDVDLADVAIFMNGFGQ